MKTIVYVSTKETATHLWKLLSAYGHVGIHHSTLKPSTRRQTEKDFKNGDVWVMIATIGFGMVCTWHTLTVN